MLMAQWHWLPVFNPMVMAILGAVPYILFGILFALDKLFASLGYYTHRFGFWRGWGTFMKELPKLFVWYVSVIPFDYASGTEEGWAGFSVFRRAPRWANRLRFPFDYVFKANRQTLREGMFWVTLVATGMQFNLQPMAYFTSGTFILVAIAFMLAPFIFNAHRDNRILGMQGALGVRDMARGMWRNMILLPMDIWLWLRRVPYTPEPYYNSAGNNPNYFRGYGAAFFAIRDAWNWFPRPSFRHRDSRGRFAGSPMDCVLDGRCQSHHRAVSSDGYCQSCLYGSLPSGIVWSGSVG